MLPIVATLIVFLYIGVLYLIFSNKINKQDFNWKRQWESKTEKKISFFKNRLLQLLSFLKKIIYLLLLPCIWAGWALARLFIASSLNFRIFLSNDVFKMGTNVLISTLLIISSLLLINKLIRKELTKIEDLERE